MPRDNDKNNDSRGRRDRPSRRQGPLRRRPGTREEIRQARLCRQERGRAKRDGERRPYAGKSDGARSYDKKPYAGARQALRRTMTADRADSATRQRDRDDRPRSDRPARDEDSRAIGGEKRPYTPRGDRPSHIRDDRAPRGDRDACPAARVSATRNSATRSLTRRATAAARSGPTRRAARVSARTATGRAEIARSARGRRAMAIVPAAIGPRENLAATRSFRAARPAQGFRQPPGSRQGFRHATAAIQSRGRSAMQLARSCRAQFASPARRRAKFRQAALRQAASTSRAIAARRPSASDRRSRATARIVREFDRPREDRPKFDRPASSAPEGRTDWQEHPRSEARRPSGRAATMRTTARSSPSARRSAAAAPIASARPIRAARAARPPREKKSGERIAKVVSRAGLASRRDAEEWIVQGRVTVNGRVINSPALDVTANDVITVDGKPLPPRERTRLFLFHKPRGLMTTHADPEGRPTVFDNLPEGLPRLISHRPARFQHRGPAAADQ